MKYEIGKLSESDAKEAVALFRLIIDELHADSPTVERSHFKAAYTVKKVKEHLKDTDCVYLVGKLEKEIVSFMFAWITDGIGNIHWLGVKSQYRRKGFASILLEETIKQFTRKSCHEARIFSSYPKEINIHRLFRSSGFEEKSFIDEQFFGVSLIQMVKELAPVPLEKRSKKIVLAGEAGQGIKLMAHTLGNILAKMGKEVSLNIVYGAAVRGGEITAELIYSDEKIETPFFEKADVGLCLSRSKKALINAKEIIIDSAACNQECTGCDMICPVSNKIPFSQISSQEFNSPVFVNMLALGRLLSIIGIKIEAIDFQSELHSRFFEENTRAIKYGYTYKD
ncbi:MAG: GNAT family N-acetyltransferase [Candidatus Scalindua sp.]|nr:GNAT family N-acetyltransferase [Candidatus Scalindua sp.]